MIHNNKYVAFDLLRGMSALLVCAGHIRNFLFVDFGNIVNPALYDKVFYFMTGLGHQAVIVFFVLSGYFVGGSVWRQLVQGSFSWIEYASSRLTRLWIVLIPSLLATLAFDSLGRLLMNNAGYDGRWKGLLSSGPGVGLDKIDLSVVSFLGNVSFLQTIAVPVFGTNGPLWSLANEFWYYLIFPFVAVVLNTRSIRSLVALVIVSAFFDNFPTAIQNSFLFWLMGWVAAIVGRTSLQIRKRHILMSMVVFCMSLASTKLYSGFSSDLVLTIATMILLVVLPYAKLRNRAVVRGATRLSAMSYSLYLFHFPFVAFCWFAFIAPSQLQPSIFNYVQFFSLLAGTLVFSFTMWWSFERHTDYVKVFLRNWQNARLISGR